MIQMQGAAAAAVVNPTDHPTSPPDDTALDVQRRDALEEAKETLMSRRISQESFPALDEAKETLSHLMPDTETMMLSGNQFPRTMVELAESKYLSTVVFGAVGLNGIQMGIQADHSGPVLESIFYTLDNLFTAIFFTEFCIKVTAYKQEYFKDRWNLFDFILTWVSVIDMWVLAAIGADSGMKMFAVLRVLRVFRAVRLLRMLRSFRELTLIVEGLMKAVGTTSWVSMLLFLLLYIFSIFCVHACGGKDLYEGYDEDTDMVDEAVSFNNYQYFGTIMRSMFTLLQIVLLTDDWYVVSRAVLERQPVILVLFLVFMAVTTFGLLNVIVGIVVENVTNSAKGLDNEEEKRHQMELLKRLESLYHFVVGLDVDGDDAVDGDEIKKAWDTQEMKELLSIVKLPVSFTADELLAILDTNGDGVLSTEEIATNLVRLLAGDMSQQILELRTNQNQLRRDVNQLPEKIRDTLMPGLMESIREEMAKFQYYRCDKQEQMYTVQSNLVVNDAPVDPGKIDVAVASWDGNYGAPSGAPDSKAIVTTADSQRLPPKGFKIEPAMASLSSADGVQLVPQEIELEVSFGEAVRRLEFQVECGRLAAPIVASVQPHGEADRQGIRKGDAILAVNGNSVIDCGREEVLLKLAQRPVVLRLCRQELQPSNHKEHEPSQHISSSSNQQSLDLLHPFEILQKAGARPLDNNKDLLRMKLDQIGSNLEAELQGNGRVSDSL